MRAETPGFVTEILVPEGRRVEAGQALVRLANPDLAARLETMRLECDVLRSQSMMSEAAGDAAGAAAKREQGERQAAELEIVRGREHLLVLGAPADGILLATRLADRLGTYLHEGDLWGRIARDDRLRAIVDVEEPWLAEVGRGAHVAAMQRGFPGERFEGRVVRLPGQSAQHPGISIAGLADPTSREARPSYGVEVEIENQERKLRPGMSMEIRIEGSRMSLASRTGRAVLRLLKGKVWW